MEQCQRHVLRMEQISFCNILENEKPQKVHHLNDLCEMFPDINFGNDDNDYSGDPAN